MVTFVEKVISNLTVSDNQNTKYLMNDKSRLNEKNVRQLCFAASQPIIS